MGLLLAPLAVRPSAFGGCGSYVGLMWALLWQRWPCEHVRSVGVGLRYVLCGPYVGLGRIMNAVGSSTPRKFNAKNGVFAVTILHFCACGAAGYSKPDILPRLRRSCAADPSHASIGRSTDARSSRSIVGHVRRPTAQSKGCFRPHRLLGHAPPSTSA